MALTLFFCDESITSVFILASIHLDIQYMARYLALSVSAYVACEFVSQVIILVLDTGKQAVKIKGHTLDGTWACLQSPVRVQRPVCWWCGI